MIQSLFLPILFQPHPPHFPKNRIKKKTRQLEIAPNPKTISSIFHVCALVWNLLSRLFPLADYYGYEDHFVWMRQPTSTEFPLNFTYISLKFICIYIFLSLYVSTYTMNIYAPQVSHFNGLSWSSTIRREIR